MSHTFKACSLGSLIYMVFVIIGAYGWVMNILYLIQCDFEPSWKAEILRAIGIFIVPMGSVLGYFPEALGH